MLSKNTKTPLLDLDGYTNWGYVGMCNGCVGLVKYTIKANTTLLVRIFDNLRWLLTSNFLLGVVVSYSLQERYLFRPDALFSVLSLWWPTHRSIPNPIIHCVETCHEYNWNSVCDVGNQSVQLYLTILNYEHSPILLSVPYYTKLRTLTHPAICTLLY